MTTIFWDTMILIYMLEGDENWSAKAQKWLARSRDRGERLVTSYLALGELFVGAKGSYTAQKSERIRTVLTEAGFHFLPFEGRAATTFGWLRSQRQVGVADAINLSCAAASGVDLFLTNDRELLPLHVPGIKFLVHFESPLL